MDNQTSNRVPRIRTIPKAYKEIKKIDPNTNLSLRGLRNMVQNKEIPSIKVNNRYLINLDMLLEKLSVASYNNTDITCTL